MPSTLITKYGSGAPLASDLVRGELAVDTENGRLYTEDSLGAVVEIGLNPGGNLDVTGTVTADGLTVDGDSFLKASGTNTTPLKVFSASSATNNTTTIELGDFTGGGAFEVPRASIIGQRSGSGQGGLLRFTTGESIAGTLTSRLEISDDGDISFYEDTGTTAKFFWDASAESLGLGTASPDAQGGNQSTILNLEGSDNLVYFSGGSGGNAIDDGLAIEGVATGVSSGDKRTGSILMTRANTSTTSLDSKITFYTTSSGTHAERMRIDSSGNVGIGLDAPIAPLHVQVGGSGEIARFRDNALDAVVDVSIVNDSQTWALRVDGASGDSFHIRNAQNSTNPFTIDTSGNVGIGTTSPSTTLSLPASSASTYANGIFIGAGAGDLYGLSLWHNTSSNTTSYIDDRYDNAASALKIRMRTQGTPVEAVTILGSGNVGIGTASPKTTVNASSSTGAILTLESSDTTLTTNDVIGGIDFYANDGSTNGTGAKVNIRAIATSTAGTATALTFGTAASTSTTAIEAMRIDAVGNVGIGTASPGSSVNYKTLTINGTTGGIVEFHTGAALQSYILGNSSELRLQTNSSQVLTFNTNGTERMRIDSNGNLLVGTQSDPNGSERIRVSVTSGTINGICAAATTTAGGSSLVNRNSADTYVGGVSFTNIATSFPTSSDQRLKENIVDAPSASDDIDAIQVRSFDWKVDGSHQKYGMVAQELITVAPEAVYQPEDPEEMMGVDYSKLVPMLIKEVQQLRARVAQLESK